MQRFLTTALSLTCLLYLTTAAPAQDARILVRADRKGPQVSRHMTGVCIEDVNHEIYGGIYSQMLFGESFQEPPVTPIEGFASYGGTWTVENDVLHAAAGEGPKLIAERPPFADGDVAVQIRFADKQSGLAGLILKVSQPGVGADRFQGYEVSLDPSRQLLVLGRHRQNWEPIQNFACEVPVGQWITLGVQMRADRLEIRVDDRLMLHYKAAEHPLAAGSVGLRTWRREASFRGLTVQNEPVSFRPVDLQGGGGVSGMWRMVRNGSARGTLAMETARPFTGSQSQRIRFERGDGSLGVENQGLNRWGLSFVAGKAYEGYLWMRADEPTDVHVAAQSGEGVRTLAETVLHVNGSDWKRYDFTLTPDDDMRNGRFVVALHRPGSVVLGHAFLQPGSWGRFRDLPVRKDVAEGLIEEGVTVMRLGGLMANAEGYRWKHMIGPRDKRAPYKGYWYPYSSNGWGIFDFLNFCEAAGFLPVVDLNMDETPQDLADFVSYANGPADTEWGKRRAGDGHPAPYGLRYIELGNEEAVDDSYWRRFKPLAESIWSADPDVVLIVGDFEYKRPITDPMHVEGAPKIKSLAAHKQILELARDHKREVWFDVHIWNHSPRDAIAPIAALATFDAALARLCPGANYRLCVLEENAINHAMRRALAHAETINGLLRLGDRVRIVCAANALQPDGQNDNGWDQGLLFLNPEKAWIQPPGYVTQMVSRHYQPRTVDCTVSGAGGDLDATAGLSDDGKTLVLRVANLADTPRTARFDIEGFTPKRPDVQLEELAGPLDDVNTVPHPTHIRPSQGAWRRESVDNPARYKFPAHSFTILQFE